MTLSQPRKSCVKTINQLFQCGWRWRQHPGKNKMYSGAPKGAPEHCIKRKVGKKGQATKIQKDKNLSVPASFLLRHCVASMATRTSVCSGGITMQRVVALHGCHVTMMYCHHALHCCHVTRCCNVLLPCNVLSVAMRHIFCQNARRCCHLMPCRHATPCHNARHCRHAMWCIVAMWRIVASVDAAASTSATSWQRRWHLGELCFGCGWLPGNWNLFVCLSTDAASGENKNKN